MIPRSPLMFCAAAVMVWAQAQGAAAHVAEAQAAGAESSQDTHVSTTIIRGAQPANRPTVTVNTLRRGDISLNFPAADVRDVSKAILGDILHLSFEIEPSATGSMTLVTASPIAKGDVLRAFEDALRSANMALVHRGGAYVVTPVPQARSQPALLSANDSGFGAETIPLRFISAGELKKLLDPLVPDTVSVTDTARNIVTVTGATGQRRSVRELIAQFDADWLRGMSFALYVTKHTDSRLIVPELDKLLNGPGAVSAGLVRLIAMEKVNGILAFAPQAQYLDDVKRWIEVLDREGESTERRLFVYRMQNGRSADLAKVLNSAFGGAGAAPTASPVARPVTAGFNIDPSPAGAAEPRAAQQQAQAAPNNSGPGGATISSDETNNAVLAFATPREYAVIEDALHKLDLPPIQVLIEAAITEVRLTHNLRYGVQWQFQPTNGGSFNLSQGATSTVTQTFPGFSYFYSNAGSITATLNALSGLTHVEVLSSPKLLVLNNHTASLQVGDQVPIITASSTSTIGTNAPTVNNVEYRDTGVILKVTPRVNAGGLVLLDIAQEVSDVTSTATSKIDSPTIQERKFASSVAVQDGQTIALGGLIRSKHTKGRSGLPFLSSIPILGALAGQDTKDEDRTELLILLTPRVVRTAQDAESVTDELRRKIAAVAPLKPVTGYRP